MDHDEREAAPDEKAGEDKRRAFLTRASSWAMLAGIAGGYGALALTAGRFLYPARRADRRWLYVAQADALSEGDSLIYEGPSGETINVTRQARSGAVEDFVALSSTCPHLGCQVHWESQHNRYFCPCHNGTFDAAGVGTGGPPGDAGLSLPRYPLKVEKGLLFIEVPVNPLDTAREGRIVEQVAELSGPGHDPCLSGRKLSPRDRGETA